MSETRTLLEEIEKFLARTGMRPSMLGHKTTRDGKTVDRLRRGRTVTLETAAVIRAFMATYVPEDKSRQKKAA
jgi:hypothetical protein